MITDVYCSVMPLFPDCLKLKEIFVTYERASGQKISNESDALDMKTVLCHERYLGPRTVTGRSEKKLFKGLADKVWKRVQG